MRLFGLGCEEAGGNGDAARGAGRADRHRGGNGRLPAGDAAG